MDSPFELLMRVRYGECDAQQVVFNARYGDYVDVAATEFYRALFGSYQRLLDRGLDSQVVRMTIDWRSPARFDDVLALRVQVVRLGTTSYTLRVDILQQADARPVAEAEVTYVMVQTADYSKTALPDDLRALLERGAPGIRINQAG